MLLVLLLPLVIAAAPGQGTARPLTLREALQLATSQSPQVQEATLAIPVAEAGVSAAGALPNPTVGVSYGSDEPRLFESLEARLPVLGQRIAAVEAARAEIPVARAELAARRLSVRAQVRRAYSALALAQARLRRTREAAQVAQTLGQMAKAKFDLGTASELEVEQASLAAIRAENDALDAEGTLRDAQLTLSGLIAVEPPERLEAADPLWPIPGPPEPAKLTSAVARHPEVVTQVATRDAATARAHEQRVGRVPVPLVSLELQHFPRPDQPVGFRAGIALDIPLLSWNGGAIAVEEARAAQATRGCGDAGVLAHPSTGGCAAPP